MACGLGGSWTLFFSSVRRQIPMTQHLRAQCSYALRMEKFLQFSRFSPSHNPLHCCHHAHMQTLCSCNLCKSLQTEPAAARLVEKLIGWGQEVTVAGAAAASGNFRVAALRPSALHVQNVPPTVLIHEEQLTSNALVRHYTCMVPTELSIKLDCQESSFSCRPHLKHGRKWSQLQLQNS